MYTLTTEGELVSNSLSTDLLSMIQLVPRFLRFCGFLLVIRLFKLWRSPADLKSTPALRAAVPVPGERTS